MAGYVEPDDDLVRTPPVVTTAVSIGTAPLPFLAVYTAFFLLHGLVHPVHPADITNSQHGEAVAGGVTLVIFLLGILSLVWFLNRRRRWFYVLFQLAVLAGCLDVLVDSTRGGRAIAGLLVATTVVSLAFGFAPESWRHVGLRPPALVRRLYAVFGDRDPVEAPASPSQPRAPIGR